MTFSLNRQRGALFGLDARIALAVFSLLAVVAGTSMVMNIGASHAKGLASELSSTARAIEAIHSDLKLDIFQTLEEPLTEARAFQALYDNTMVREEDGLRARWNGPYINATGNVSAQWGEMSLQKRQGLHTERCDSENLCFLWLVYGRVKPTVVAELNEIIDGNEREDPAKHGRLQWSQDVDDSQILYYRATKALAWYD